jgi:hypothetical protein
VLPEHPYFQKSGAEKKRFQRNLVLGSFLLIILAGALLYLVGLLLLIPLVIALLLSIIAPFIDVPGMVRAGKMRYFSPFLLCEAEKNQTLNLHAGTLFDFYFMFPKAMPAAARKRLAHAGMIEGLLNLIAHHENNESPPLKVRTTSYILNQRSARKLGLEKQPTDLLQNMILYYNYFNLMASYCLLNRRLGFPSVKSVQTFEADMAALIERKPYLEKIRSSRRLARPFE